MSQLGDLKPGTLNSVLPLYLYSALFPRVSMNSAQHGRITGSPTWNLLKVTQNFSKAHHYYDHSSLRGDGL